MKHISIENFIFSSNQDAPIIASYKGGSIISKGEGGNRHLFIIPRSMTMRERKAVYDRYWVEPNDSIHIWIDTHVPSETGEFFIGKIALPSWVENILHNNAKNESSWAFYFSKEGGEKIIADIIKMLR